MLEGIGFETGLFNTSSWLVNSGKGFGLINFCVGSNWECGISTATEKILSPTGLKIYPNPATTELSIQSPIIIESIEFINTQGQIFKKRSCFDYSVNIDINELNSGYHLLSISLKNGQVERRRFIKN